jgi:hypothetical protein
LDTGFPTLVRYVGLGMMIYATLIDHIERPSLIVAATGMMLFKTVLNGKDRNGKDDRWSHLP